jgi:excisionase family DNA binding protein
VWSTGGSVAEVTDSPQRDHATSGIEPRLLTLEDVATYLNVSASQAYALVRSGKLPGIKLGGRGVWRVDRKELDAYVERLQEETREWTQSHPLTQRDSELEI